MEQLNRFLRCFKWGRPLVIGLIIASVALGVFAGLGHDVVIKQAFGFDQTILTALYHAQSTGLTLFAQLLSTSAAVYFLGPIMVLLGIAWWRDRRSDFLALLIAILGAFLLNLIVKGLFERARPSLFPHLVYAQGYSFPSGHSQAALAFYGTLAYLLARRAAPHLRIWYSLVAGVWIVLVGMSRNYLEVHYPSDVLAAFVLTLPWVLAVIFVHQCQAPPVPGEEKAIQPAA